MSKRKADYWRQDKPEPIDYASHPDPQHTVDFEVGHEDMLQYVRRIKVLIKKWVADPSFPLDDNLSELKSEWVDSGGSESLWDSIVKNSMTNVSVKKTKKEEEKPFNGLDFSGI